MTRVKLCGLSRKEDIAEANALRPDYIGFVFWEGSRRFVTADKAISLSKMLDPSIVPVGVFLNADIDHIIKIADSGCIRMVQLHGDESEELVKRIQERTGLPVIRAFRIEDRKDIETAVSTEADLLMLDGGIGSGTAFDWSLLEDVDRPYFLAGGLDGDNVREAISKLHPFAVDVSSGIETDGLKDPVKMKRFIEAARTADGTEGGTVS